MALETCRRRGGHLEIGAAGIITCGCIDHPLQGCVDIAFAALNHHRGTAVAAAGKRETGGLRKGQGAVGDGQRDLQQCIAAAVVADADGIAVAGGEDQSTVFVYILRAGKRLGRLSALVVELYREGFVVAVAVNVGDTHGQRMRRVGFIIQQRTVGDSDPAAVGVYGKCTVDRLRLDRIGQRIGGVENFVGVPFNHVVVV